MKIWECEAGRFTGYDKNGCQHVTGIRYATSERYERPVPFVYPEGVHACTEPATWAVQPPSKFESTLLGTHYEKLPQDESPQFLSITIPTDDTSSERVVDVADHADTLSGEKLPVMVWFHGGAYRNGGCDSPSYDRSLLAGENKVIVVGINYRLSVLGFVKDRKGNYANHGLLDAIEALRWLQKNIAAFGGDPRNITLFGQSAGADLIRCIMLSKGTDDLYRRAIIESDPIGTMEHREAMERKILDELNELPLDAPLEEIRQAQLRIVDHVTEKGLPKHLIFAPHYGVEPLPDRSLHPLRIAQVAKTHDLLIGTNEREVAAYIGHSKVVSFLWKFPPARWIIEKIVKKISHAVFIDPSEKFAREYAEAARGNSTTDTTGATDATGTTDTTGTTTTTGGRTYLYRFHWMVGKSVIGAGHGAEYLPLFGIGKSESTPLAMGLSGEEANEVGRPMRKIWADFARTGEISHWSIPEMIDIEEVE